MKQLMHLVNWEHSTGTLWVVHGGKYTSRSLHSLLFFPSPRGNDIIASSHKPLSAGCGERGGLQMHGGAGPLTMSDFLMALWSLSV